MCRSALNIMIVVTSSRAILMPWDLDLPWTLTCAAPAMECRQHIQYNVPQVEVSQILHVQVNVIAHTFYVIFLAPCIEL